MLFVVRAVVLHAKRPTANLALKTLHGRLVQQLMGAQRMLLRKRLATLRFFALEGLLSGMNAHVLHASASILESPTANAAGERFLARVDAEVDVVVTFLLKLLWAIRTLADILGRHLRGRRGRHKQAALEGQRPDLAHRTSQGDRKPETRVGQKALRTMCRAAPFPAPVVC